MKTLRIVCIVLALFSAVGLDAQCNVAPDASLHISNDTLYCTNTSTNTVAGTSYTWTFFMDPINSSGVPSGTTINTFISTNPPQVFYAENGAYRLELLACNDPTCATYSYSTQIVICSHTPSLTYTVNGGNVTFSTNASGAGLVSSHLLFGNNDSSYVNPVTYTYFNGTYAPTLIAIYANYACIITVTTSIITVTNNSCSANAAFTYTTGSGGSVTFSNSAASDPNMAIAWNFGDGTTSTLKDPVHTYGYAGNYNVLLYKIHNNASSCRDSNLINVNITGIPCIANSNFSLFPVGPPNSHT